MMLPSGARSTPPPFPSASLRSSLPARLLSRPAATAVEFAIIAGVFFTFVLGFMELGRGFMIQHLMSNAARQGCRVAILEGKSSSDVNSAVYAVLNGQGVSGDTVTVQVDDAAANASTAQPGDEITVSVSIPASAVSWVPAAQFLFGTITGKYTMRRE